MDFPISHLQDHQHMRPTVHRSRSHSSPYQDASPAGSASLRPAGPQHTRSHSLLPHGAVNTHGDSKKPSNLEKSERSASDKHHRIHLPSRMHHHHAQDDATQRRRNKIHRYTQSLAEQHHYTNSHSQHSAAVHSSKLRTRDLRDEGTPVDQSSSQRPSPADLIAMSHPSAAALARIPSTRSYHRGFAAGDATYIGYNASRPTDALRRRATSDPRAPSHDVSNLGAAARPKTQIELDLERADRLRRQRRFTLTNADVAAKDKDIAAAEDELREDLQMIGHRGMEITRRLDYGYYNLLEKVGNLASVIQSLQSLSTQSGQLVRNLEGEAEKIDDMVKSKASDLRKGFEERDERAKQLESRGKEVQRLAEEMGQRLETARAKVEKWEEEESQRQEVWSRFVARVWGMAGSVVFLVVAIVVAKEVWLGRAAIKDLIAPGQGNVLHNTSLAVGMRKLEGAKERIPEDVKRVLVEIEERNRNSRSPLVQTHPIESQVRTEEPEILRVLNEL